MRPASAFHTVIVRLDRTIQYSRDAEVLTEKSLGYWMPRLRGA
jgi:hypothetical protein